MDSPRALIPPSWPRAPATKLSSCGTWTASNWNARWRFPYTPRSP